jgi:membrane-bound inhibitor of C-type lysozyme
MFDPALLCHFEDLLGDESATQKSQKDEENIDDDETVINKLDANSLTLKDLLHEMEMRNLQPRGFFEDDAKFLQEQLDKEHEEYLESKRREKQEAKELEASQAMLRRRKALQEIELSEEQRELKIDKRTDEWFRLIKCGCSPTRCRIDVNDISARTLARLLWSDKLIVSLDVCTLNLSDSSGAYLARTLKNNTSIIKLEMNENYLGSKTCKTLADALCSNNTLKYLSMESNPLTANNGKASVEALVNIIRDNKSLQYFSLWRCNIGIEGGRELSEAMQLNEKITHFELGYNFWDFLDIQKIEAVLVST